MNLLLLSIIFPMVIGLTSLLLPNWQKLRETVINISLIGCFILVINIFLNGSESFSLNILKLGKFDLSLLLNVSRLKSFFLLFINFFTLYFSYKL